MPRAAVCLWLAVSLAPAMPAIPGSRHATRRRLPPGVGRAEPRRTGVDLPLRVPVILVDFPDNVSSREPAEYARLLFGRDCGSMADYYAEASYGAASVAGEVVGWVRLGSSYAFYCGDSFGLFGRYPGNSQGMVAAAVRRADPLLDFSRYDADEDGMVDCLMLVHAGPGAEETGQPGHIWSHKWQLSETGSGSAGPVQTDDGVRVDVFAVQPERFAAGELVSIGVFCHEYGHVLGLPDLYDTDYSSSGLGGFCLMAAGGWGRASESELPGSSPAHPSGWCKYLLGWTAPDSIEPGLTDSVAGAGLVAVAAAASSFRLLTNPGGADWSPQAPGRGEYFLVENRQRLGFDRGLPGSGLLILHVDEAQPGNDDERRPLVGILQADGSPDPALPRGDRGSDADLWKSSNEGARSFTVPATTFYDGVQSGAAVANISAADSVMTADLWIAPLFLGRVYSFPNPVLGPEHGTATIVYEPSDEQRLAGRFPGFEVRLYNLAGEPVRRLNDEPVEISREHRAAFWDLKNERGRPVASGMYFYLVTIDEPDVKEENTGRLTVIR